MVGVLLGSDAKNKGVWDMKTFFEQRYPVTVKVRVTYDGPFGLNRWIDEHKGLNVGHALYLARMNWPDAEVIEVKA